MTVDQAREWLARFEAALAAGAVEDLAALFVADSYWRDLVALTWDIVTERGREMIAPALIVAARRGMPVRLELDVAKPVRRRLRNGVEVIEAFLVTSTRRVCGRGVLRLRVADGPGDWQAWTLLTAAEELVAHPERVGPQRRRYATDSGVRELDSSRRLHEADSELAADPDVVVVGGGQSGLSIAARLAQLDVSTLVVEKNPRIGDNWRDRYRSLTLHGPIDANHMPYLRFPDTWPVYIAKDLLADWLESYPVLLGLHVWTGTQIESARYAADRWELTIIRSDGRRQLVAPRHLVISTGLNGLPNLPQLPGAESFRGRIAHSSGNPVVGASANTHAIIIGAGNSALDLAQELHNLGADVTIVQRGPTTVLSLDPGTAEFYAAYRDDELTTEDADLLGQSVPYALLAEFHQAMSRRLAELDRDLLARLQAAGFRTDYGADGTGFYFKYLRGSGGSYLDVGCAELIAIGAVAVRSGVWVDAFTPDAVILSDGSRLPADLVIFATGFSNMSQSVRALLGESVADRLGSVGVLDATEELRNLWKPTAQPGLWIHGGSLPQVRTFSRYLALQIAARLHGQYP